MSLRKFLYFNKSDRKVLLFLLSLAGIAVAILTFFGREDMVTSLTEEDSVAMNNGLMGEGTYERTAPAYSRYNTSPSYYRQENAVKSERFAFDPNAADSTALLRLGLAPWQVRNIYRYRAKGGRFRRKEDFAQIYGVTKQQYDELCPYIRISPDQMPAADFVKRDDKHHRDTVRYPVKLLPTEFIVLNRADTTQLKKVPGIGSGWARRIISYGERLGGYVDVMQLTEMENFPQEALNFFVVENPQTRKININKLTLNQLRQHPYINFYQARDICDYRRLKGPLQSLEQLRLLEDFSPEALERLAPYVEF